MDKKKDFVDNIIDLFCESYKAAKGMEYSIGKGKTHYYSGVDRGYIGYLLSIYKKASPDADSEKALSDMKKYFDAVLSHEYPNSYLQEVTLYKVCFKLNDYKAARNTKPSNKGGFDQGSNRWSKDINFQEGIAVRSQGLSVVSSPETALMVQPDTKYFHQVTKLPEQTIKLYTDDEMNVITDELLRCAKARDENYSQDTVTEWIRCFGELNMSVSQVVKAIRLAKLQPKYASKEFAMFLKVDLNDYYHKYPTKK
jgi:hypothetical protein